MPCFAAEPSAATCDRDDSVAVLDIGGAGLDYAQVTRFVDRAGAKPSEVRVLVRNVEGEDDVAASVLLRTSGPLSPRAIPGYSRARLTSDGETLGYFNLASRKDMGQACAVEFVFKDDRWLLEQMPIHGSALCQGDNDDDYKYSALFPLRVNPRGLGNCKLADLGGAWKQPLFTDVARRNAKSFAELAGAKGQTTSWTVQYAMQYLWWFLSENWDPPLDDLPYLNPEKLAWPAESLAVFDKPECQKVLPDLDMNGWSALAVLEKLLQISGDYGLKITPGDGVGVIGFYAKSKTVVTGGHTLFLQRAGPAEDIKTIYDFLAETDYSDAVANLVVEGAPFEIEAEFLYSATEGTDTLEKAWEQAEEDEFKAIVTGDGTYASVLTDPATGSSARTVLDGSSGKQLIVCKTREAIMLAREHFPRAFRAFRLRYQNLTTILKGFDNAFQVYDSLVLQRYRAILAEQLQLMLTSAGEKTDTPYPVRIQVKDHAAGATAWHQVMANAGLRVTADGTIWLDGLTDDLAGNDNIYSGYFMTNPAGVVVKDIKLNATITHDMRVRSVKSLADAEQADPNLIGEELDASAKIKGAGPTAYVLATGKDPSPREELGLPGYRVQHQVGSNPTQNAALGGENLPLSRVYRDDTADLVAHAARRFKDVAKLQKAQHWVLIGIRPDLRAGDWLHRISFVGQGADGGNYEVNAPIAEVVYDFDGAQKTTVSMEQ